MDITRREFVAGLAAGSFLCGCGGTAKEKEEEKEQEKEQPPATPAEPPPATGTTKTEGELVAIPAGISAPGDQAKVTLASGLILLVWKDQVGFHATEARCTHRRGELFYDKEHNDIWCNEHGSRFYVDGAVAKPPAKVALKAYSVEMQGDQLLITPRKA
jgi:nitrite reductase/ring-hydroxylating ferredoxin subunit